MLGGAGPVAAESDRRGIESWPLHSLWSQPPPDVRKSAFPFGVRSPTLARMNNWESVPCALCADQSSEAILEIPCAEAPGGHSFVRQCRQCGLRRLDPRPGAGLIGSYYAKAGGDDYNAYAGRTRSRRVQSVWNFLRDGAAQPACQSLVGRLLSPITALVARWAFDINVCLGRSTGLKILEVGAGYGDILIYLQERGAKVLGTDLSSAAAAKAAEFRVEVRLGTLRDLALPDAEFDHAIMCHSLEHVPDPNVELAELSRILRPGGLLHIAVPNGRAVRLKLDGVRFAHLSFPLHYWFFDSNTLSQLLRTHGFELERPPRTTTRHHALKHWLGSLKRSPIESTREFLRFLRATGRVSDGGDVLRIVARRRQG